MMPDIPTPYRVPGVKPLPALAAPAPLDPRLVMLLVGLRRCLLLGADVIGEVLGLAKRE